MAGPAKTASSKGRTEGLKLALAGTAFLGVLLLPAQPGLTPQGQRVLAIVAAAVVLWATEAMPVAVSALLLTVLLMVMGGVATPSEALVGFSSPILFFLVGSLAMGAAIMRSGLAARLARFLVDRSGGDPRWLTVQLLLAMPLMAFAMPSAINRNAMLIPAYEQVFRTLGVRRGDPLARVVMLALGVLNPFASSALMTGGLAPMTTSTLLGGFTWFRWFALMAVPYYVLLAVGGLLVFVAFRPGRGEGGDGGTKQDIQDGQDRDSKGKGEGMPGHGPSAAISHGPSHPVYPVHPVSSSVPSLPSHATFSREEKLTLVVVGAASVLWLTDFVHHWNAAVPALMAAAVLMMPGVGVLTWSQFEKTAGWSNFFVVGASLSLTQALVSSGAAAWFARGLLGLLAQGPFSPVLVALFVILVTTVVHLGVPNMSACIALLIPMVAAFATATGTSPVAAGLIVGIVVDAVVLYPVQTATNLLAYETGHFDSRDVLRIGLGMLVLTTAVVLLVAIPWWGLMGLSLSQ